MSFEPYTSNEINRLVLSVARKPKAGGTHLALTFPEPIYLINLDYGLEEARAKFPKDLKLEVASHNIGEKSTLGYYKQQLDDIEDDWFNAVDLANEKGGTVVMDTSTQHWQLTYTVTLYDVTNKDDRTDKEKAEGKPLKMKYSDQTEVTLIRALPLYYAAANTRAEAVYRRPLTRPNVNAVFIDRMTPKYDDRGQETNQWVRQGYNRMEAIVAYAVELQLDPQAKTRKAIVTASRADPMAQGLVIDDPDYEILKAYLLPQGSE